MRTHSVKAEDGAAMVESALSVVVFLFVLLTGVQFLCVGYVAITVQSVIFQGGRYAILGPGTPAQRVTLIKQDIQRRAASFGISIQPNEISICPETSLDCTVDDAGLPEKFIIIELQHPVPLLIFGGGSLNLQASALVRNEPYATS